LQIESHFSGTHATSLAASLRIASRCSLPAKMRINMSCMILEGKSPNFRIRG